MAADGTALATPSAPAWVLARAVGGVAPVWPWVGFELGSGVGAAVGGAE